MRTVVPLPERLGGRNVAARPTVTTYLLCREARWRPVQARKTPPQRSLVRYTSRDLAIAWLAGSGNVVNSSSASDEATLTINGTTSKSHSGVIQDGGYNGTTSGTIALVKDGSSTQTLSGDNTYSGTTTVSGGTLVVNGDMSGATGAVSVASGATLGGSGTVGGATTVSGILSPGTSPGTLTFADDLDISAAEDLIFELGTSSDQVVLSSGTLTIGSGVIGFSDFTFSDAGGLAEQAYVLFDTDSLSGTLDAGDLTGSVGSYSGRLSIEGTDVVLTLVPEPATMALLSLGGLALLRRRRSR